MTLKTVLRGLIGLTLAAGLAAGCGQTQGSGSQVGFNADQVIVVISREDGSGTRGAFVELAGVQDKDKIDRTTKEAEFVNQTGVVLTSVQGSETAIGYISLGSLNDTVKAVKLDGAAPTAENVKNGSYTLARPFNIAYKGGPNGLKKDFIHFIFSKQGQAIAEDRGAIAIEANAPDYQPGGLTGKLTIAGSSSVTPVMEKLVEAYMAVNPNTVLELQQSDSSAGMKAVMDGTADIGMASRELKDSEKEQLNHTPMAMDGIAVIVNRNNPIDSMTKAQIAGIYKGELTIWSEIS
mgnify:CR=1 FL=1